MAEEAARNFSARAPRRGQGGVVGAEFLPMLGDGASGWR